MCPVDVLCAVALKGLVASLVQKACAGSCVRISLESLRPGKRLLQGLARTSCAPVAGRCLGGPCAPVAVHKIFCGTVRVRALCASWVLREVVLCGLVPDFFMAEFLFSAIQ